MQINNPSTGGATTPVPFPLKTAGGFYSPLYPGLLNGAPGAYNGAANQARMYPIYVPVSMTISPVTQVTGTTGGNMIVAIYSPNANGGAGALLKSFTPLDCSTTGLKTTVDTLTIAPGNYWVYLNTSAGPTCTAWQNNSQVSGIIGVPSSYVTASTTWGGRYEGTFAYASPAPASAVTLGLALGTAAITSPLYFAIT